jgi:DNA processing protein
MIPWLCVPGVGLKSLEKITAFQQKQNISWKQIWQRLSILLSMNVISMKQFLAAEEYKKKSWSAEVLRRRLAEEKITVVCKDDALYPQLLREIDQPPPLLFVKGNVQLLKSIGFRPSVAVVGTRRNTPYGDFVTRKIVEELTLENALIISGGMYGIDAIAHKASIENNGETIAVLGSGVAAQGAYWQQLLCQQIIDSGGLVISEFFPWQSAQKAFFPRRNRIVAGLANAVVVIEAAEKSGSLITAQFGLDLGREVCAVPGSITNQYANGTKWLINQGAVLVSSGSEILKAITIEDGEPQNLVSETQTRPITPKNPNTIVQIVSDQTGISTEKIADMLHCSIPAALEKLSELEVTNRLISQGQKWFLAP